MGNLLENDSRYYGVRLKHEVKARENAVCVDYGLVKNNFEPSEKLIHSPCLSDIIEFTD